MLKVIMEFVMVDERFTKVYSYHFVFLNHFRYGNKVFVPYYLVSSLNDCLVDHIKSPKLSPFAH